MPVDVGEPKLLCRDAWVIRSLGNRQKWWCPACDLRVELGTEVLAMVGNDDLGIWPVLVHSECREGIAVRMNMAFVWETLPTRDARMRCRNRIKAARRWWHNEPEPDPKPKPAAAPKAAPAPAPEAAPAGS